MHISNLQKRILLHLDSVDPVAFTKDEIILKDIHAISDNFRNTKLDLTFNEGRKQFITDSRHIYWRNLKELYDIGLLTRTIYSRDRRLHIYMLSDRGRKLINKWRKNIFLMLS